MLFLPLPACERMQWRDPCADSAAPDRDIWPDEGASAKLRFGEMMQDGNCADLQSCIISC